MVVVENMCCGCPSEMCIGSACRLLEVEVTKCDRCGSDAYYRMGGEDFCEDCLREQIYANITFEMEEMSTDELISFSEYDIDKID